MSLFSVIVVPPAMLILRKMIRRIKTIAHHQFTGNTRILETLQETVQGIRIVKAFTLEDGMRARFDAHVAELEKESNKWARIAYRSGPLMEALGGFAMAIALVYGGYRVIETGATPGQFFSFLAAFMLAYEPAKRLARLNIDLNSALVGVRILFDVIDHPPTEQPDDGKPPLKLSTARVEFANVQFAYRPGERVIRNLSLRRRAGQGDRPGRTLGRRQVDHPQSDPALLRGRRRRHRHRRAEHRDGLAPFAAQPARLCRAGRLPVSRLGARQHRARPAGRDRGRDRRRRQGGLCPRLHHGVPARLRHAGRRARRCRSPAASASASPSRARCSRTRRSSCSTRPPLRSIPNPSGRCSARSSTCARGERRS